MTRRDEPGSRVAVFVVTILVVIAGSLVGPVLSAVGPPSQPVSPYGHIDLVPDRDTATGQIDAVRGPIDQKVVVIDTSHGNRLDEAALNPLETAITQAGHRVELVESRADLGFALREADAVIITDPSVPYSPREANVVESFVDRGGRLLLLGEPDQAALSAAGIESAPSHIDSIAPRFGIEFGRSALSDLHENDGNHRNIVGTGTDSAVGSRVDRAVFYTATHVDARGGQAVVVSPATTESDRAGRGPHTLAVRTGNVAAVGDTTFIQRGNYRVENNERLVSNLLRFLLTGDRARDVRDYPFMVPADATVRYTSSIFVSPAQRFKHTLARHGIIVDIELDTGTVLAADTEVLITSYRYLEDHPTVADKAGMSVSDGEVSVPGYTGPSLAVVVIHTPDSGFDLVIVSDTPERTASAIGDIAVGKHADATISNSTIIIRGNPERRFV